MSSLEENHPEGTIIHPRVAESLQKISIFPEARATNSGSIMSCRKVRVEGKLPAAKFVDDPEVQTPDSGYIVTGIGTSPPILIANNDNFSFEVWKLVADENLNVSARVSFPDIHPDHSNWVGFYALDAACLPGARVLVAVGYYNPRVNYALYVYDIDSSSFSHLADVEADIRDPYKFFEVKSVAPDTAVVLYYSGRTRKAAEIYHNYFNHFVLFSPAQAGLELLRLGIDTGNVTAWMVQDDTLYMQTEDARDPKNVRHGVWSLNLSRVLKE